MKNTALSEVRAGKGLAQTAFAVILTVIMFLMGSCGGGGGSSVTTTTTGDDTEETTTVKTGGVKGYVYVPIGSDRKNGTTMEILRAANAVPTGYLAISGATIKCGGKSTTSDASGYFLINNIAIGKYTITISAPGYQTINIIEVVTEGEPTIVKYNGASEVTLDPTSSGSVVVTSTPSGAEVVIDGKATGYTTPATIDKIKPGSHVIYTSMTGYSNPDSQTVVVAKDESVSAYFEYTSVTATITPNVGKIKDTYVVECDYWSLNSNSTIQARCDDANSWSTITNETSWPKYTMSCRYTYTGVYRPGCRINESVIGETDIIVNDNEHIRNIEKVDAGGNAICVLTDAGGVKCWGFNGYGQLGNGTTDTVQEIVDVSGLTSGVKDIALGLGLCGSGDGGSCSCSRTHVCALMNSGGVKCWGNNLFGQLGDGTTTDRSTPVDVSGLSSGVVAISAGGFTSCALLDTGGVKCWGSASGDGTNISRTTPVDVSGLTSGVVDISSGYLFSCALLSNGGVKCWGDNGYGQLGGGTNYIEYAPVDVSGLTSGVAAISAGGGHTCVLMSTGGVKCFGNNFTGQLGNGTTTDSDTPVNASGLTSGVVAVSSGFFHTCVLLSTGDIKCWGDNECGELGRTGTGSRYLPMSVSGLASGVESISMGGGNSCAVLSNGDVQCWGYYMLVASNYYSSTPIYIGQ